MPTSSVILIKYKEVCYAQIIKIMGSQVGDLTCYYLETIT